MLQPKEKRFCVYLSKDDRTSREPFVPQIPGFFQKAGDLAPFELEERSPTLKNDRYRLIHAIGSCILSDMRFLSERALIVFQTES